jgi:predicted site-specific integrase-resolvase
MSKQKPTLSAVEAARKLGMRMESLYRVIYAGLLTAQKTDGKWVIDAQSAEDYAAKHSRNREAGAV